MDIKHFPRICHGSGKILKIIERDRLVRLIIGEHSSDFAVSISDQFDLMQQVS